MLAHCYVSRFVYFPRPLFALTSVICVSPNEANFLHAKQKQISEKKTLNAEGKVS